MDTEQLKPGLNLLLGPMRCGKTEELLRVLGTFDRSHRHQVLLFKPAADTRVLGGGEASSEVFVESRNGCKRRANLLTTLDDIQTIIEHAGTKPIIIGIDEGHFVPFLPAIVALAARRSNIKLLVSALNSKYDLSSWDAIKCVQNKAADVRMLHGLCDRCCTNPSSFNWLHSKYHSMLSNQGHLIGDEEYKSVCLPCWYKYEEQQDD